MYESINEQSKQKLLSLPIHSQLRINETVWSTRKARQETEKDIELLLNRLQLLKKEETLLAKKINDTTKRTQEVLESKQRHNEIQETKKNSKKEDEQTLKFVQKKNLEYKKLQEDNLRSIKEAMKEMKRQESLQLKKLSLQNQKLIESNKKNQYSQNCARRSQINKVLQNSKSNIESYWHEKIGRIQMENENKKKDNLQAQQKNELLLTRLEDEENSLIAKLQKSQELQEQLGKRLERAMNLPNEEFKKIYQEDDDLNFESMRMRSFGKQNKTASLNDLNQTVKKSKIEEEQYQKIPLSWLPPPENYEEEQEAKEDQETKSKHAKKDQETLDVETKEQGVGPDSDRQQQEEGEMEGT